MPDETPTNATSKSPDRRLLRLYAVPVVLCVVAMVHIFQWARLDRSSWGSGCSFGMFCTVDYHDSRFVKCYATMGNRRLPIEIGDEFATAEMKVRVMPTRDNLIQLCHQISHRIQLTEAGGLSVSSHDDDRQTVSMAEQIAMEVWGLEMHGPSRYLSSRLVNSVTYHCTRSTTNSGPGKVITQLPVHPASHQQARHVAND